MTINTEWTPLTDWKDLPEGTWLVKVDKDRKPYNVADVSINESGTKLIIVGNYFSWDMGDPIAYSGFTLYDDEDEMSKKQ